MDFLWFVVGVVVGALLAWLVLRVRATAVRVELQTKLDAAEEVEKRVQQAFASLASEALRSNNESFLQLAKQSLETQLTKAQGALDLRRQAVEELVKPLSEALHDIEKNRQEAYGGLKKQVETVAQGQGQLADETRRLVQALRVPQVRGRWGEMTLRRVAELAGMVDRCDFAEQQVLNGDHRGQRPDMVVYLPNERCVAVDAKTPLDAYLQAIESGTDKERATALQKHARQVRDRIHELSSKSYWASLGYTPEFVVLFLPGEFFLGPALQEDPKLLEDGMHEKVVVATPSTLIALLHAVAYGWREEQLAENAREISDLGRQLHDRVAVWAGHVEKMRNSLLNAVDTFNDSVGSLEHRVLVSARRFTELGISTDKEITRISSIEVTPRPLTSVEKDGVQGELPAP